MKPLLLFLSLFFFFYSFAQPAGKKTKILALGVFHFEYPDLDAHRTNEQLRFDILSARNQKELDQLLDVLAQFKPTHIAIELEPKRQPKIDSLYQLYLNNQYTLHRGEVDQIGLRLAKKLNLSTLHCVDAQGAHYPYWTALFNDAEGMKAVEAFYHQNSDSAITNAYKLAYQRDDSLRVKEGLLQTLKRMNELDRIKKLQGAYLTGLFKYRLPEQSYAGADFESARWYNRNLRIFRNLQEVTSNPEDRILLIIGAGHLGVLYHLIECSPEYELVLLNDVLKKARNH